MQLCQHKVAKVHTTVYAIVRAALHGTDAHSMFLRDDSVAGWGEIVYNIPIS